MTVISRSNGQQSSNIVGGPDEFLHAAKIGLQFFDGCLVLLVRRFERCLGRPGARYRESGGKPANLDATSFRSDPMWPMLQ